MLSNEDQTTIIEKNVPKTKTGNKEGKTEIFETVE